MSSIHMSIRLPFDLRKRLEEASESSGKTMNQLVIEALNSSVGAVTEESENTLLVKEAEQLSAKVVEMGQKSKEELDKSATLAHFYGVFESREPLKCLDQALKDFDECGGVWRVEDRDAAEFSDPAEVIRALAVAHDYVALKKRLDGITAKLRTPLEGWEEEKKKLEEKRSGELKDSVPVPEREQQPGDGEPKTEIHEEDEPPSAD